MPQMPATVPTVAMDSALMASVSSRRSTLFRYRSRLSDVSCFTPFTFRMSVDSDLRECSSSRW